jgi:hypothetical protein
VLQIFHWSFPKVSELYSRKCSNAVWHQAIQRKDIDDPANKDLSPNEYIMAERFTIELHELFKFECLRTFKT